MTEAKTSVADIKQTASFICDCKAPDPRKWSVKVIKDAQIEPQQMPIKTDSVADGDIVVPGLTRHTITCGMSFEGGEVRVDFVVYTDTRPLRTAKTIVLMAHGRQCMNPQVRGFGGGQKDLNLAVAYVCPPDHSLYRFAVYPSAVAAVKTLMEARSAFVMPPPNALLGPHTELELQGVEMDRLAKCIQGVLEITPSCDFAIMTGYEVHGHPDIANLAENDGKIPFHFIGRALKHLNYETMLLLACRSPWNGKLIEQMLGSGKSWETCNKLYNAYTEVVNF